MPEERAMWRALILLPLLLMARPVAAQGLDGAWFGERWTGRLVIQHLSHRGMDGRFTVRFRFFQGCTQVGGQAQAGRWALDGAEFRTWVETVDGAPPQPEGREMAITYQVEGLRRATASPIPRRTACCTAPSGWQRITRCRRRWAARRCPEGRRTGLAGSTRSGGNRGGLQAAIVAPRSGSRRRASGRRHDWWRGKSPQTVGNPYRR